MVSQLLRQTATCPQAIVVSIDKIAPFVQGANVLLPLWEGKDEMNHCRDDNNEPICLECVGQGQDLGELSNAVNASMHAIKCAVCGGEIPTIMKRTRPTGWDYLLDSAS